MTNPSLCWFLIHKLLKKSIPAATRKVNSTRTSNHAASSHFDNYNLSGSGNWLVLTSTHKWLFVNLNPTVLLKGLPYALGLMTILGIHELGHYLTAKRYKIRSTLPYFIPMPFFLGTFGAFIQMRSPIPNRKALFDVSIAGPIAGFVATLPYCYGV